MASFFPPMYLAPGSEPLGKRTGSKRVEQTRRRVFQKGTYGRGEESTDLFERFDLSVLNVFLGEDCGP